MKKAYPFLLVILSGAIFSLAWPAAGFPLLLFVAFIPLFYAEDIIVNTFPKSAGSKIWALSYIAFLTWNICTTWWVYLSSAEGGYMAMGCNSLFMSWVYYLAFVAKRKFGKRIGYFSLIVFWVAFEFLHMNWKLSWPWLTIGNGFAAYPEWVQWYEYTGVLGGTVWVIVVNILLYEHIKSFSFKKTWYPAVLMVLPIIISYVIYGSYHEKVDPVRVSVIQPNVDPYNEKFANGSQAQQFFKMMRLAQSQANAETDYIVFPETALPNGLWSPEKDSLPEFMMMRDFLSKTPKAKIIVGATYFELFETVPPEGLPFSASRYRKTDMYYDDYNAAFQVDTSLFIPVYKKSKLVPGPESYPLPEWAKPLQESMFSEIGGMMGNLGTQKERTVFFAPDKPSMGAAPIICYESIYGEFVTEYVQKGATVLFIITNDGWWGNTAGHRQHFQYARLRAIETRRSIARSANTGISGFVNQRGDIIQSTPYAVETAITETINANDEITFYTKHGDYIGRGAVILGSSIFLYLLYFLFAGFIKKKKSLMEAIFCTSNVLIRNGNVWKNGELVLHKPEVSSVEFLRACYDLAATPYPKFFKMDNLCKLAWVGAELLQQGTDFLVGYKPEEKGIVLQNSASSLDTDIKHVESIASNDAYFPSPAVFVYTLPNITAGEICIRQQIKGSSAFFIFEALDADFLLEQAKIYLHTGRIRACILGITEWIGDRYETCLFLVEKETDSPAKKELTSEFIQTVYTPS